MRFSVKSAKSVHFLFVYVSIVCGVVLFILSPVAEGIRWLALHNATASNWTVESCAALRRAGTLRPMQARACRARPAAMGAVATAAARARSACREAAAHKRWNCSSLDSAPEFTPDLLTGTREQAFVYALAAAALTWSVARACAAGALAECSCAPPPRRRARRFKWGGCGDNVRWAGSFAKQFIDAHEIAVRNGRADISDDFGTSNRNLDQPDGKLAKPTPLITPPPPSVILGDERVISNISTAGEFNKKRRKLKRIKKSKPWKRSRRRKKDRSRLDDPVSFYRDMEYRMAADDPRFDPQIDLDTRLKRLQTYIASANLQNSRFGRKMITSQMATKCTCHGVSGSCSVRTCWRALPPLAAAAAALAARAPRAAPLRPSTRRALPRAAPARLLYVTPSPDYCEPDVHTGSLGTHGRWCNASLGSAAGGCSRLCCGRGRRAVRRELLERCHCRYQWCCRVNCQVCRTVVEDHYCN